MARKGLYLGGSALLLAVVLLLVFWGRPADAEIQVLKAPRAVVWKDFLGVNAQFLWFSPERYNKQIDRALRNAGVPAIWSTEWGWSAYKGPKELQDIIGVEGQADYVLRRLALMSALDYDRIFLFTLSDLDQRASVRDRDYGLLDLDANPKPVYLALQRFLKVTGPKLRPADPPVTEDLPDGSFSIGWTREDGRNVWLFWSARGGNVRLPKLKEATLHDPLSGKVTPLSGSDGLEVPVKSSLQMLVWE
ncbi:beta-xylosidase [Pseudomonas aeruginosa VRFPA09]|nr:beta-xylosidase [Pseudomonas aeruginosa VRFPA09]